VLGYCRKNWTTEAIVPKPYAVWSGIMANEVRYLVTVNMESAAMASGIRLPGFAFQVGFIANPTPRHVVEVLERQKNFESNPEIRKSLELCKNAVILFGLPTVPQGRDEADLAWGDDRRSSGIKPSGITSLREIRYLDNTTGVR